MTGDERMTAWQRSLIPTPVVVGYCTIKARDTAGQAMHCTEPPGHPGYHRGPNRTPWTNTEAWGQIPIQRWERPNHLTHTDPRTGMRHGRLRHHDGHPPVPWGCRWCGTATDEHWGGGPIPGRPHQFAIPTVTQIKLRMIARRNARKDTT